VLKVWHSIPLAEQSKGKNTRTAERGGQQLVIQFVETNRPLCFHELNHKLLVAQLFVCFYSMAWVCGRTPAGIAGSNPAGGMDVCVL
jgi:hypothetical protein